MWDEVLVRAPTPAFARIIAGTLDVDADALGVGNETLGPKSGFIDEKLYRVRRHDGAAEPRLGNGDGDMKILSARQISPS